VRVVNLLPQMIPGKQQFKPVKVKYTLPIVFEIQ
jgi:protein TonB